jgi:HPt (histidine-containing phosphotransfer) domain-containing protein
MNTSFNALDNAPSYWSMTPELRDIADADSDMMQELITLFLDDSAERLRTLSGACVREDFKIIRAQAHSLKGSALQMGAPGMASLCAVLEVSDRPVAEQRDVMTRAIDDEFALVRRAIEKYRITTAGTGD